MGRMPALFRVTNRAGEADAKMSFMDVLLREAGFTPSARTGDREGAQQAFAAIPGVDRGGLVSAGLCLGISEYDQERGHVFGARLPANYLQVRPGHRGMFPCFLGGSVARFVRNARSAWVSCSRVS